MFKNKVAHIWEWFGDHTIKRLLKIRSEYVSRKKNDVERSHSMSMGKNMGTTHLICLKLTTKSSKRRRCTLFELNNKINKITTLLFRLHLEKAIFKLKCLQS